MTIGTGTFLPSGRFSFPRAYILDFYVYRNGNTVIQQGNKFIVTDAFNPQQKATFICHTNFLPWSSNGWTLDHIIVQSFYVTFTGGPEIPLPFNLDFQFNSTLKRNGLYLGWIDLKVDPQRFPLDPAPADYWLPKPLP